MISFIVPAYNEEQLLGRSLAAIHAAACELGRPYEVIVVDDASTDRSRGTALVRSRDRQSLWYGERRDDADLPA